jgi:STE24 endopeptidase
VSARRAAAVASVAVLAAVWAVSAWLLWQTKVPSPLHLPHVDTAATFPREVLRRAESYDHVASLIALAGLLVEVAVLAVYAWWGPGYVRESAAGPIGTGMLLGMLGFGLLWLAEVPFQVLGLWWDRRHGVSHTSYWETVLGGWLVLGFAFVLLCVALLIVMGLARLVGDWWWILAAPVFVGLAALFAFGSPYLESTHPIEDPALARTVAQLERKAHVGHVPVRIENVSGDTSLPNAVTEGLGPSQRVVIWDTLLDGRFSQGEVAVVIAHELGHVKRQHIRKAIAWYALFAFPGAYLISRVTRRRGGMGEPAAVPLALLVLVVLELAALPLQNTISRHMEAEADWLALQTTRDPRAATALFKSFVPTGLSDPAPPTWEYLLAANHPTIDQRIAMVRAWQRSYATSASASAAQLP